MNSNNKALGYRMQQLWKKILVGIVVVLLVPILLTLGIAGKSTLGWRKSLDLELYLPMMLCQQIDWNYEEETLKAQAVLARSSLYLCVKNGEISNKMWKSLMEDYQQNKHRDSYQKAYARMEEAVYATRGQILLYENKICEGAFHKVSAGYTRDGVEILKNVSYRYLSGVKSGKDIYAEEYLHGHYFSEEALRVRLLEHYPELVWSEEPIFEQIEIVKRDAADYVTRVRLGDRLVSGEELRVSLELASANFTVQRTEGKIRFLCKGLGHGLGMSQFGANELAKDGSTYKEILGYYFPLAKVTE